MRTRILKARAVEKLTAARSTTRKACTLALVGCMVASVLMASPARAAAVRSRPILFVHGYDFWGGAGADGSKDWPNMINALQGWGWSSPLNLRLSYYYGDKNFDHSLDHHGDHCKHQGGSGAHRGSGGCGYSHTQDTPIEHLAYHLAWMIYDHFSSTTSTRKGQDVDLVGHSMGGLIIREMLAAFQLNDPDYPSQKQTLRVEHVVTLGTPHAGTALAECPTVQCRQMRPGSASLKWWAQKARNPQGTGGTDWTLMGSSGDQVVTAHSAVAQDSSGNRTMDVPHRVYYTHPDVDHTGKYNYMNQTSDDRTAVVESSENSGNWKEKTKQPRPVRWTDLALVRQRTSTALTMSGHYGTTTLHGRTYYKEHSGGSLAGTATVSPGSSGTAQFKIYRKDSSGAWYSYKTSSKTLSSSRAAWSFSLTTKGEYRLLAQYNGGWDRLPSPSVYRYILITS
jgi:pimeloyl-ACP methyl ester carboxylesterase